MADDGKKADAGSASDVQLSDRTKSLLERPAVDKPREKVRTTLYLDAKRFARFRAVCKKRDTTPSEVMDSVIADILDAWETTK